MENNEQPTQEQEIPQQEVKPEEVPTSVDAAMFIHSSLPIFRAKMDRVTGTQAKRILEALIEAPFADEQPTFTTTKALDLYNLGLQITNAKFLLFNESVKDLQSGKLTLEDIQKHQLKEE